MGNCPSYAPNKIGALCYSDCPKGQERVPGVPTLCRTPGAASYGRGVGGIPGCPKGQVKDGALCYDDPGSGWRVVGGVAWQDCPAGSTDIGALCWPSGAQMAIVIFGILGVIFPIIYLIRRIMSYASSSSTPTQQTGTGRRKTKTH